MLGREEEHVDFLERQFDLIKQIGIERYVLLNAAAAPEQDDWLGLRTPALAAPGRRSLSAKERPADVSGLALASSATVLYQPVEAPTAEFGEDTPSHPASQGGGAKHPLRRTAVLSSRQPSHPIERG
jgi:hypothetical protein